VREDILGQKFLTPATTFFAQATTTIDLGYAQAFDTLLPTLELLITQRMDKVRGEETMTLVLIGLVLALAAYLVAGMYQAVTANIHHLAMGADAIASGDWARITQLAQEASALRR
jgi:hypothetical protein